MTLAPGPILVTGASSGIGKHLTVTLSARGQPVYATARKDADLTSLGELENVTPLRLDVRDPATIRAARETVERAGQGLYGLVNNAGIGGLGGFSTFTDEDMLEVFDVNVFGPHRLTTAFLPRLLESRGMIVNVGSMGGQITGRYFGPYTRTKHALEAYSASLREEMGPHGVGVSIVQPGGVLTEIDRKSEAGTMARLQSAEPPFDEEARALMAALREPFEFDPSKPKSATNRNPSPPEAVTRAVTHALVGKILDANQSPALDYSREELITMLDKQLQERESEGTP